MSGCDLERRAIKMMTLATARQQVCDAIQGDVGGELSVLVDEVAGGTDQGRRFGLVVNSSATAASANRLKWPALVTSGEPGEIGSWFCRAWRRTFGKTFCSCRHRADDDVPYPEGGCG